MAWVITPSIQELQLASRPTLKSLHWFSSSGKREPVSRLTRGTNAWDSRMSGKVWVSERGVWFRKKVSLPWSLIRSLSFPGSLSLFPRLRENLRTRLNVLPLTRVSQTWACLQAGKENSLFHSNFFLRDHFLYPNNIANEFCFKSSILKESSILKSKW